MKKLKGTIIAALTILIFFSTGCGNSEDMNSTTPDGINPGKTDNIDNPIQDQDRSDESWQAEYSRLEKQYELAVAADNIYGCYIKDGKVFIDSINKDNISVDGSFALPDSSSILGMTADTEGNVYLLGTEGENAGFWKIDTNSNLQDFVKMELEDIEDADDIFLKGIYSDQSGNLYVWCEMQVPKREMVEGIETDVWYYVDRVYIKDEQSRPAFYVEIADAKGTQVLSFQVNSEGTPLFIIRDRGGIYIQEIDAGKEGLKDGVRLDESTFSSADNNYSLENVVPIDNGFLYCQGNTLYEFHYETQKSEKVLSLSTYGIFLSDILFLSKNGDTIEMIDNHGNSGYSEHISFRMGVTEKQILTLGVIMTAQDLERTVMEFNRYNSEYVVEMVDYYVTAGGYDDALEKFKLDVVTGKAPDIIAVSGIDYNMFSEKGVLADLYEFMQKDEEFTKDMLVPSASEAYEDGGHLYSIAPAFQLHSMWGYADVTGGRSGVTFHELFQVLANSGKDLNAIAGFSADEPVLTRLCTVSMDEFVDWENGTCDFDGEYFKEVLSFAKEYTGNYTGGTYTERIRNREVVMTVGIISSVVDYQIQEELYGGEVGFIGYPVADGSGTAIAFRGSDVAINAKQENQAGAWEFVKFYLLHGYDGQGFPIVKQQFDQVMAAAMEEDYFVTEDGGTLRDSKGNYYDGDEWIFVYEATREEVDVVVRLVESARNRFEPHWAIQSIINEEAAAYFSGQVDLGRTAEKIQNRVSLLLQESM